MYLRRDHIVCKMFYRAKSREMNIYMYTSDIKAGLLKYKGSYCFEHTYFDEQHCLSLDIEFIIDELIQVCCSHLVGKTLD